MKTYGCVECQREHNEVDPLYEAHMMRQSKHGIYEVSIETALKAALVRAEMAEKKKEES